MTFRHMPYLVVVGYATAFLILALNAAMIIAPTFFDEDLFIAWTVTFMLSLSTIIVWGSPWSDFGINLPRGWQWRECLAIFGIAELITNLAAPGMLKQTGTGGAPETMAFFMAWSITGAVGILLVLYRTRGLRLKALQLQH